MARIAVVALERHAAGEQLREHITALDGARARAEEVSSARGDRSEKHAAVQRCEGERVAVTQARDARAEQTGLRGWIGRLDELRDVHGGGGAVARHLLGQRLQLTPGACDAGARV